MTLQSIRPRRRGPAERGAAGRRRLAQGVLGLVVLVAACWGTLLALYTPHIGEPVLVSTAPIAGQLVSSPGEVRLEFDRPVPAGLATIRITDPSGEVLAAGRPYNPVDRPATVAVAGPRTLYQGSWTVAWAVPTDGERPVTGSFEFHVRAPGPEHAPAAVADGPGPVARGLYLASVALGTAAGTLGTGLVLVLGTGWPGGVRRPAVRRTVQSSGVVLVLAGLVTFELYALGATGAPLSDALDPALLGAAARSGIGGALLLRVVLLVPLGLGAWQLLTATPPRRACDRWLAALTVLGASSAMLATFSLARPHGHTGPTLLGTAADTLLLLTLAACVAGPVALWMVLRWARDPLPQTAVQVTRFLPWAAGALLVVGATTTGGWQRVACAALAVVALATGVATRRWAAQAPGRPGADRRRSLTRLAAVAAAVAMTALVGVAMAPDDPGQALVDLSGHHQTMEEQDE